MITHCVEINDLSKFMSVVFGADCFVKQFPRFIAGGKLPVHHQPSDDWYYVLNDSNEIVHDTCFFTRREIDACMKLTEQS